VRDVTVAEMFPRAPSPSCRADGGFSLSPAALPGSGTVNCLWHGHPAAPPRPW